MGLEHRLSGYCRYEAQMEVNRRIGELNQTQANSNYSGPVVVVSVENNDGVISLTVRTQDGRMISGVQPGSSPAGPGKTAILNSGKKLDG